MKIAVIGRSELLYDTATRLEAAGHEIVCILTAKEAPEYRRKASDFKQLSSTLGIPFAQGPKILEHVEFLRSTSADIAVSINYTGVVPQSVIDLFPLGILNAHGGDLPRYRGNACQAWAIINGENSVGLCIHRMIGGELDSGDIIAREYLPIDFTTKVTSIWSWMNSRTPELMLQAVQKLAANPDYFLEQQSKDPEKALRCYPRKPEDGRIDWSKSAIDVLRLINACNKPYAGAFCYLEGEKVIIWDAQLIEDSENYCAIPGQITHKSKVFFEVACSSGKLRILEASLSETNLSALTLINSIRLRLS